MLIFCFCWFLVLYGLTYMWGKNKNIFSPLKFVAIKYALLNLSFIFYVCCYPRGFNRHILKVCKVTLSEAFLQYTIVQTIAFASLITGIVLFSKKPNPAAPDKKDYKYAVLKFLVIAFFGVGCMAYGLFLHRIGGLSYLLNNLDKRIALQGGQYILNLLPLLVISCLLLLVCIKLKNKIADKILLGLFIVATLSIFNSFGSRENSIIFIITLIVAGSYVIRQLEFNQKSLAFLSVIAGGLFFYVMVVPAIRRAYEPDNISNSLPIITARGFVYNISYTYIDVFVANYFNKENAWYLDGYFAPVTALFAKPDKSMIPQVDQGVYFNTIVTRNKDFRPPMPRKDLSKTSWPTENFGFAYSNFLIPGIIIFFFLQGMVFSLVYRVLQNDIYNPVVIMLYVLVIFTFNFSSLRLAMFIKIVPLIYLVYIIFNRFVRSKSTVDSFKVII